MQVNYDSVILSGRVVALPAIKPVPPVRRAIKPRPAAVRAETAGARVLPVGLVTRTSELARSQSWEAAVWLALGVSAAVAVLLGFWI